MLSVAGTFCRSVSRALLRLCIPVRNAQFCQHALQITLLGTSQGRCHISQPAQVLEVTAKLEGALQLFSVDGVLSKQVLQCGHKLHIGGFDYVIIGVVGEIFEVLYCHLQRPFLDLQPIKSINFHFVSLGLIRGVNRQCVCNRETRTRSRWPATKAVIVQSVCM